MFVMQYLREELEQWKKAYKDLLEHGPKNLPLARSRVSWLYIEFISTCVRLGVSLTLH